jgi:hypothetical protein
MLGGEAGSRVAGFWLAVGREPPVEPDHLGALLGLWAALAEAEEGEPVPARRRLRERARAALLHEHLLPWLPLWLARVDEIGAPPYRAWAALLGATLRREAARAEMPSFPVHLAWAPAPPDPRASGPSAFPGSLLVPVRTGMILVRDDLARCAHETGLGLRQGERRWVLAALLGQDASAVLAWLGGEARRQSDLLEAWRPVLGPVADFWRLRARASARLLDELAAEAVRA